MSNGVSLFNSGCKREVRLWGIRFIIPLSENHFERFEFANKFTEVERYNLRSRRSPILCDNDKRHLQSFDARCFPVVGAGPRACPSPFSQACCHVQRSSRDERGQARGPAPTTEKRIGRTVSHSLSERRWADTEICLYRNQHLIVTARRSTRHDWGSRRVLISGQLHGKINTDFNSYCVAVTRKNFIVSPGDDMNHVPIVYQRNSYSPFGVSDQ